MIKRMVYVEDVELISVTIASVATIGDVYRAAPSSKVLAVQKEGTELISGRFNFEDYSIFSRESSPPLPPITINSYTYHTSPIIVGEIDVTGVSTAGIFQIGGIDHIQSSSRVKHFRLLKSDEPS